jgi:choline transporter-like protein 2/4/5
MPCLALFIIYVIFLVSYVWTKAFSEGDPDRLINGVDFENRICGKDEGVKDKPLAYWPAPTDSYRFKVCTKDCDATNVQNNMAAGQVYKSKPFYGRYCLPDKDSDVKITGYNSVGAKLTRQFGDVQTAFPVLAGSILIATFMAFFFIWLMKMCVGCLVWSVITLIVIGGTVASYVLYDSSKSVKDSGDAESAKIQFYLAIFIAAATFIFFCVIVFMRNRIRIAIAVIKSASRAIGDMKLIVLFPLIPLLILIGFFFAWFYATVYIFSAAGIVDEDTPDSLTGKTFGWSDNANVGSTFAVKDYDSTVRGTFAYHFFFLLWVTQVLIYFTFTVVAGAVGDWYFTERDETGKKIRGDGEGQLSKSPVSSSCFRTTRYHLGTIIYAALIIAIIQFARSCVRYLERACNGGKEPNRIQKLLFKLVNCLLWCLECCLDKVSRNALVFTAIYGDAFCPAVCGSFALVWANLMRLAVINLFSMLVTALGKVFVPLMTVGICGAILVMVEPFKTDISSPVWPLLVIAIFSLAIGMLFIIVYDTAIDTVFLAFLIDEKYNKGKKMMADDDLRSIVDKYEAESAKIASSMKSRPSDKGSSNFDTEI